MPQFDINIIQGADFSLEAVIKNDAGVPLNLTSYSGLSTIRQRVGDTGYWQAFDISYSGASTGLIRLSLTAANTLLLPVSQGVYDLDLYAPNGSVSKPIYGYASIYPNTGPIDSSNQSVSVSTSTGMTGWASDSELLALSGYLLNLIQVSAAGVFSVNGLSGVVNLIGQSGIAISSVGQNIYLSYTGGTGSAGSTGNYLPFSSGSYLENSIQLIKNTTGAFALQASLSASGLLLLSLIPNTGSLTGQFYPRNNPSGFVTATDTGTLVNTFARRSETGQFITSIPSNVASLNSLTGAINLIGTGNVSISTGVGQIIISGNTGAYASFIGQLQLSGASGVLQTQITSINSVTGQFYPNSNPSGFVTGNTGVLYGVFAPRSETGQFATIVQLTGASGVLQSQISGISSVTGQFYLNSNPSGFVTGNTGVLFGVFAPRSETGQLVNTSQLTATSGYLVSLISAASAGVSTLNSMSGVISLIGAGNVSITTGVGQITISGNTGIYASFVTTGQTGSFGSAIISNVVYTTGDQIISGVKIFSQSWTGASNASNTGVYINITNTSSGSGRNVYFGVGENGNDLININSQSGVQIPNGTMGSFNIQPNPGPVTLVEVPIFSGLSSGISGISNSGQEQSYSFNMMGTSVAKVYAECDGSSGIQNAGFFISEALNFGVSGRTGTSSFILGTKPFYVNTSTGAVTWTMPPLNMSTGRTYFIKNRGNTITLTGALSTDTFFGVVVTNSFGITSGQAYIVANAGLGNWEIM